MYKAMVYKTFRPSKLFWLRLLGPAGLLLVGVIMVMLQAAAAQALVAAVALRTQGTAGTVDLAQALDGTRPYWDLIKKYAPLVGGDEGLLAAVMAAESGGNPAAVSPAGALGLMQVMPDNFAPGEDPFDPETNVRTGAKYLALMLEKAGGWQKTAWGQRFSALELALAAYNAGPAAVEEHQGVPPFPETVDYVARVLSAKTLLAKTGPAPSTAKE